MSAPVFLADPGLLDELGPGSRYVLEGAEARHAGVVQRRRVGERVDVVDGAGVRLRCVIAGVAPGRVDLDVVDRDREPTPGVRVVLAQALAKGDRDELAIEAATEVGVDEVVPWQAGRSVVVWRGDRAAKSRAKWLATVRQASKQSRRAHVPVVGAPVDTPGLVALVGRVVDAGGLALVLHEGADAALSSVTLPGEGELADPVGTSSPGGVVTGATVVPEVLLVVGPEGGVTDREVEALVAAGGRTVRLGPHVLRTSTAGPVATALVCERLGRWA